MRPGSRPVRDSASGPEADLLAGRFATPALTLPTISPEVPRRFEQIDTGSADFGAFARHLATAGVFNEMHLRSGRSLASSLAPGPEKEQNPLRWAVGNAITDWLYDLFAGADGPDPMSWMGGVVHNISESGLYLEDMEIQPALRLPAKLQHSAAFYFKKDQMDDRGVTWTIGPGIMGAEEELPGAGRWVYSVLLRACQMTCMMFGPIQAFETCEHIHWYGHGDESQRVLAEIKAHGGKKALRNLTADDVIRESDILTIATWHATMPAWAWEGFNKPPAAPRAKGTGRTGEILDCARELLDLLRCAERRWRHRAKHNFPVLNDAQLIPELSWFAAPLICRWKEDDMIGDMFDDGIEQECNSGSDANLYDHSMFLFDPGDARSVADACGRMEDYAEILRCIGALLNWIGTRPAGRVRLNA